MNEFDTLISKLFAIIDDTSIRDEAIDLFLVTHRGGTPAALSDSQADDALGDLLEQAVLPKRLDQLTNELLSSASQIIDIERQIAERFRKSLLNAWSPALNLMQLFLTMARESGTRIYTEFHQAARGRNDFVFEALIHLHARACRTFSEILALLETGHADGANARWRTLHELAVVARFLVENGQDAAERYLLHFHIEAYRAMRNYQQYASALGVEPLTQQESDRIMDAYNQLCARFGNDFRHDWGWAHHALGLAAGERPRFTQLEEAVQLDYLRPRFTLACHPVHAGSQGIRVILGLAPGEQSLLLAGPSDVGLVEPGHAAALGLWYVTDMLLKLHASPGTLVLTHALGELSGLIGEALSEAHDRLHGNLADEDSSQASANGAV